LRQIQVLFFIEFIYLPTKENLFKAPKSKNDFGKFPKKLISSFRERINSLHIFQIWQISLEKEASELLL